MSDLDLLVEIELLTIDAFGYGSYRHEHRTQQRKFQERRDTLQQEAVARGLLTASHALTPKGQALNHGNDPRVTRKVSHNQTYFTARFGGVGSCTSPYGERY